METLEYKLLRTTEPGRVHTLHRAHESDAGLDLRYIPANGKQLTLHPGKRALLGTGIAVDIPHGYVGLVCSRSGLALNSGVIVLNAPGVVDAGYQGEIGVILYNTGERPVVFNPDDRIAQLVVQKVELPTPTPTEHPYFAKESERSAGGFGSTGLE